MKNQGRFQRVVPPATPGSLFTARCRGLRFRFLCHVSTIANPPTPKNDRPDCRTAQNQRTRLHPKIRFTFRVLPKKFQTGDPPAPRPPAHSLRQFAKKKQRIVSGGQPGVGFQRVVPPATLEAVLCDRPVPTKTPEATARLPAHTGIDQPSLPND